MEIAKTVFGGRSTDGYSDKANKGGFSRDIKIRGPEAGGLIPT